jgi:hypothetical protein
VVPILEAPVEGGPGSSNTGGGSSGDGGPSGGGGGVQGVARRFWEISTTEHPEEVF